MPELPEVEIFKRYLDATALHKEIRDVKVYDDQVLAEIQAHALRRELQGRAMEETRRHGKYLFVRLSDSRWLEIHFGMSGHLRYFKDMRSEPEYDQVLLNFENGYYLAYIAPRKLGEIDVLDSVETFIAEKDLGPDVLAENFDRAMWLSLLADRRGMIKSALMDQSLMAGIGNVYSDEMLFQMGIHPRTKVKALSDIGLAQLYNTMQEVLNTAIDRHATPSDYPESYLTPHRGPDGICPECGEPLERVKVTGRPAYVCTNRQDNLDENA